MRVFDESEMVKGWFVGDFNPTAFGTKDCEVSLKRYKAGDYDERHLHKVATEVTLIVSGVVEMNGKKYSEGKVIVMDPGEATDFRAITDVVNVVVKVPSVKGDKFLTG